MFAVGYFHYFDLNNGQRRETLAFGLDIIVQREMWQAEAPGFEDPKLCYEAHGWEVVRLVLMP